MLKLKCFACQRVNHLATDCPYLHYTPSREKVIQTELKERKEFRENFVRGRKRRFHTRADNMEIVQSLEKLRFTYFSGDSALTKEEVKNMESMVGDLPDCLTLLKGENTNVINEVFKPQTSSTWSSCLKGRADGC